MKRTSHSAQRIDGRAVVWSGLTAGTIFLILEMLLVPGLGGGSPLDPVRMIGAIVLGPSALAPGVFSIVVLLAALTLHYLLSVLFALLLTGVCNRMSNGLATFGGLIGGIVIYLVNYYVFTGLFPWFAAARSGITVFTHLVFGVTAVLFYLAIRNAHRRAEQDHTPLIEKRA